MGPVDPLPRRRDPEAGVNLDVWVGAVGIGVFALVILAGMLLFASRDEEA